MEFKKYEKTLQCFKIFLRNSILLWNFFAFVDSVIKDLSNKKYIILFDIEYKKLCHINSELIISIMKTC